jgi:methyl-accepting chemotaxis protein
MARKSCWEKLNCGREQACPAYPDHGRNCFAVTSTMCRGERQGTYEEKISACRDSCAFYEDVMAGA